MRRFLHALGSVVLWLAAACGVVSGLFWAANALGWVQPLVVVSGSMEPAIMTGDLLLATPVPVEELAVGELATLPSTLTGALVTHRVLGIEREPAGYRISMRGDANPTPDVEDYLVPAGESIWQPSVTLPGMGRAVLAIARPGVVVPALIGLAALLALALLPAASPRQGPVLEPDDEDGHDQIGGAEDTDEIS